MTGKFCSILGGLALLVAESACAQKISANTGVDEGSGIHYAMITVEGKLVGPAAKQPEAPPRLTAQCTRDAKGKLRFELLMDAGGGAPLAYFPPWKATKESLFPPMAHGENVTMEFLGYTKVKPVKRRWNQMDQISDEWTYATPGLSSSNMEEITFYNQYLKALPTLRLTFAGKPGVEFETAKWQVELHKEPLCGASTF